MASLQWVVDSCVGPLHLVASAHGLQALQWQKAAVPMAESLEGAGAEVAMLARSVVQIEEYFAGQRQAFELPLDLDGTPFQQLVWRALLRIPYGTTKSYSEVASSIGSSKATRAVGTANAKNPLCVIVPCHRVIAADGSLGGYSGGLAIKQRLLKLEQPTA